jgi:hypothetical protein
MTHSNNLPQLEVHLKTDKKLIKEHLYSAINYYMKSTYMTPGAYEDLSNIQSALVNPRPTTRKKC